MHYCARLTHTRELVVDIAVDSPHSCRPVDPISSTCSRRSGHQPEKEVKGRINRANKNHSTITSLLTGTHIKGQLLRLKLVTLIGFTFLENTKTFTLV